MRNSASKLKNLLVNYYGIMVAFLYIVGVIIYAILKKDGIYVALTDNMDSNIPILKMIRDNHLFWKFDTSLPFLGGCLSRFQYKVELSVQSWLYILFPPIVAYYCVYICKVILSTTGFYYLAKSIRNFEGIELHKNLWCICGLLYAILGSWPHAALGFASIPWWVISTYLIYKTGKKRYIFISLGLIFLTSFTMLGIFVIFYIIVFYLFVLIRYKRVNKMLSVDIALVIIGYFVLNSHHVIQGIHGSSTTIKSLKQFVYCDSIMQSIQHFVDAFLFRYPYYHTGGATLRYTIIPGCLLILLAIVVAKILIRHNKIDNIFSDRANHLTPLRPVYYILVLAVVFNALVAAFDNNMIFRKAIPFASGFSFSRFEWLSPFFWIVLVALVCEIVINVFRKSGRFIALILIVSGVLSIVIDPHYSSLNSMYNDLHCAVMDIIGNNGFKDSNHEWKWKEYYSEELFEQIKKEIEYDGEWAIAFGIEPSVLQYNGISTLDGYYSNYDLEYHDLFQLLIKPELDIDPNHQQYWTQSCGHRAYIYSPEYDFVPRIHTDLNDLNLYIDKDILTKMGGKYVFSRFRISNADELNMQLVLSERDDISPYEVYVYRVE